MMSQLIVAPCILIAALVLLWFQIRYIAAKFRTDEITASAMCRHGAPPHLCKPACVFHASTTMHVPPCTAGQQLAHSPWYVLRWATFIGLAMLLLSSPATGFFVKRLTGLRKRMLVETDTRVKLMNQLLTGIRVLKLYAWEAAQEAAVSISTHLLPHSCIVSSHARSTCQMMALSRAG